MSYHLHCMVTTAKVYNSMCSGSGLFFLPSPVLLGSFPKSSYSVNAAHRAGRPGKKREWARTLISHTFWISYAYPGVYYLILKAKTKRIKQVNHPFLMCHHFLIPNIFLWGSLTFPWITLFQCHVTLLCSKKKISNVFRLVNKNKTLHLKPEY